MQKNVLYSENHKNAECQYIKQIASFYTREQFLYLKETGTHFAINKRRKMSLIFNLSNQPVGQIQVSNYALACQTSCIPCMCLKRRYAVPWIDREKERPTRGEFCLLCHCVTYLNLSSQRKQWQSQEFVCADKSTHISISNNMAIAIKLCSPISNMISYCSVKN